MAVSQRVAGSVLLVVAQAAGVFRRTPIQRLDQQLSWLRTNQAFFATGACHILAWVCRDAYPDREIMAAAMRLNGDPQVSHVYATWGSWAFDHSGWNVESELVEVNAAFEAPDRSNGSQSIPNWATSVGNITTASPTSIGRTRSNAPTTMSLPTSLRSVDVPTPIHQHVADCPSPVTGD